MSLIQVMWQGPNGSVWDLYKGTQGLTLTTGLSGLHLPAFKHQASTSARVPGRRYLGTTWDARDVVLNLGVGDQGVGRTGREWRQLEDLVWKAFDAENPGLLYVITDAGGYRQLSCRMSAAPDPVYPVNPAIQGWAGYSVTLTADNPWWQGVDITTLAFQSTGGTVVPYYGGAGGGGKGPPYVTSYAVQSSASAPNPGDRQAYPRWVVNGPGTWTIGLPGHTTTLPYLPTASDKFVIDTDPMVLTVRDANGANVWPLLGAYDFTAPIPPGVGQPLVASVAGASTIGAQATMTITPTFQRAW